MKKKKGVLKRILLIIAIAFLIWMVCDICVTLIFTQKIPHRYVQAEEGREFLLANTEYYGQFTQNDIDFRLQKSDGTMDELLNTSAEEIRDFNFIEKYLIDRRIAKMVRTLKKEGYTLPQIGEIVYIKTDMTVEMGASGYTHGTQIYLNSSNIMFSVIPGAGEYFDKLLWHELFHCLTRNNPEFRSKMYSLIHFTVTDAEFELPPCVREKYLSNPDVEHHDSYATFMIDGQEKDCFTAWITTMNYSEAQSTYGFDTTALIPIDGTDTYYTPQQTSNFYDVFGTNTGYVIDPEECMADNFAFAMLYGMDGREGQGYPNPEIIQGVIDIVSR
ncbi:MAG: hypothetical protein K5662_05035 [Lachnospiraceae bacterium]|nr:hypothetical protein [Lachnospiraceae bacterium]